MNQNIEIDAEMQELIGLLNKAIVPRKERRASVWHTNPHSPYYSRIRYKRIV